MSTNRFLSPVNSLSNLSNGSANIYVSSVSCSNLTPSKAVKSNAVNQLISTDLSISDVSGLQSALDDTISTPHIGTIEATDFKTQNISSVDRSIGVLQLAGDDAIYKSVPTTQVLSGDLNLPSSIGNVNVGAELGLVITQANGNTANISTLQTKTDNMSNPLSENKTDFNGFVRYNGFIYDDPPSINTLTPKVYVDTKLSKTEPNIQVLTGDIQIPMGETSALVGQNLYDLNSTSNELLGKTVNIDISTFTDYTKLNGNTQTGLLTVKRDDLAPTSANTFEIKNASDTQIYAIDGLGHNVGADLVLKHQVDGSYVRIRSQTLNSVRGIYNNYGGVERPIITWTNTSTSNTGAVLIHSNNAEMIRMNTNADASTRTIIIKGTATTVEGTTVSIKDPATTKAINLKFSGINAGIYSFGVAPYATELPVLTWGNNNGGAGTNNTNWVFLHSSGLEIMRVKTTLPSQKEITFQGTTTTFNGNVLIPETINSLTPVGGKFSQYLSSSISNTTEERSMFATGGVGSRIFVGNTFALGDTYKITIGSVVSSTSTPDITLRFKLGGVLLTSVVIEAHNVPSVPNTPLNTDVQFNITSLGTSGTLYIQGRSFLGSTMTHILSNIATIDTTSSNILEITGQWTAANISNTLTTLTINVFKIY